MARRYSIKGKPKAWVIRDKDGKFKNWVSKKRAHKIERRKSNAKPVKPGYGHRGDIR